MPEDPGGFPPPMDDRTRRRIVGFAFRLTGDRDFAEDVAQETLLRVLRGGTPTDLPYLLRVALNVVRSEVRRIARRRTASVGYLRTRDAPETGDPARVAERAEDRSQVWAAVGHLPDREREALLLRYSESLSCSDISRVLGITPNAVSCLLHRGKDRLRGLLSPRSLP